MANEKYDNLTALMTSGQLNWAGDPIYAFLQSGATYHATDTTLSQTGGTTVAFVPVPRRSVGPTGELLGLPVVFDRLAKDEEYQVVIAKDRPGDQPLVLAFYDVDATGQPLSLKNNGTLIVRPELVEAPEPPQLGVWVAT